MSDTTTPTVAATTATAAPAAPIATLTAATTSSMVSRAEHYTVVILVAVAIIGGFLWHEKDMSERAASASVAKIQADYAPQQKQDDQVVQDAQAAVAQSQKNLAAQLAAIATQKQQPVEPVDYARIDAMIAQRVGVPQTAVQTTTSTTGQAMTELPTEPLRNYELGCAATTDSLSACTSTNNNLQAEVKAITNENTNLAAEEKQEAKIAAGGSFWHRVGAGLKHGLCGAGAAGAGFAMSKSGGSGEAAIGAAGTFAACELWASRK